MEKFLYKINPNVVTVGEVNLNEGQILKRKFLDNTEDQYECQLKFIEVEEKNEETGEVRREIKPFVARVGQPDWIMEFNPEEYEIGE